MNKLVCICMVLAVMVTAWPDFNPRLFASYRCDEFEGQFGPMFRLSFADATATSTTRFTINYNQRNVAINHLSGKGVVDWKNIDAVVYKKFDNENGVISISFLGKRRLLGIGSVNEIDFGKAHVSCWESLVSSVGGRLVTRVLDSSSEL